MTQPLWKEEMWQTISCAVRAGVTPDEAIEELMLCWLEAIDDQKKGAEADFEKILRKT
jgi:hypothetical protein